MSLPLPDSFNSLLTDDECAQIDQTLLPTRDRFSIRLKVYSSRYLTQAAQKLDTPVMRLTAKQIFTFLYSDLTLQKGEEELEDSFVEWFGNLLTASLTSLEKIAKDAGVLIEDLSLEQIIDWHRRQAKDPL